MTQTPAKQIYYEQIFKALLRAKSIKKGFELKGSIPRQKPHNRKKAQSNEIALGATIFTKYWQAQS